MTDNTIKVGTVKLDGVVIGMVMGVQPDGTVMVIFPGNPLEQAVPARATVPFTAGDVGAEVALIFEQGDPSRPIAMGRLLRPATPDELDAEDEPEPMSISVDGQDENVVISGKEQIVLRCGRASITLTKSGKILLRGAYISSRSSGANRIKGGSIHLN